MSCDRAFEIDIAAFLAEAGREEFAEYRAHYPVCPECSAEVRAWTDLHALLQSQAAGPGGGHPEPAALLRYEQRDAALDSAGRAEIERHLTVCPGCRDELSALRGFDFAALEERLAPARRRLGDLLAPLRAFVLHPAFAYGLVALLLYPALSGLWKRPGAPHVPARERFAAASEAKAQALVEQDELEPSTLGFEDAAEAAPSALSRRAAGRRTEPAVRADRALARGAGAYQEAQRQVLSAPEQARSSLAKAPPESRLEDTPEGPVLRVRVPEGVRASPEFEVRLRYADGRRELRARFSAAEAGAEVEPALPPDWRETETYSVEIVGLD